MKLNRYLFVGVLSLGLLMGCTQNNSPSQKESSGSDSPASESGSSSEPIIEKKVNYVLK